MDPMALLQYQFLMAKAAEYRAIAARQAMIANARLGGFPTFDPHRRRTSRTWTRFGRFDKPVRECELLVPRPAPAAPVARS